MKTLSRKNIAIVMQALLLVLGLSSIYTIAIPDSYKYSGAIGVSTGVGLVLYFAYCVYAMASNHKSGMTLHRNFKDPKEYKARKLAGEDSETFMGDELSRALNNKAATRSWTQVIAFILAILVMTYIHTLITGPGDNDTLLNRIDGFYMLLIMLFYMQFLKPVVLYELSSSDDSNENKLDKKKIAAKVVDRLINF
jgi:hypothetical protein